MGLIFVDAGNLGTSDGGGWLRSLVLGELSLASLLEIQVVLPLRELESGTHRRHPGQRGECGSGLCIIISRVWEVVLVPWGPYMGWTRLAVVFRSSGPMGRI